MLKRGFWFKPLKGGCWRNNGGTAAAPMLSVVLNFASNALSSVSRGTLGLVSLSRPVACPPFPGKRRQSRIAAANGEGVRPGAKLPLPTASPLYLAHERQGKESPLYWHCIQ